MADACGRTLRIPAATLFELVVVISDNIFLYLLEHPKIKDIFLLQL